MVMSRLQEKQVLVVGVDGQRVASLFKQVFSLQSQFERQQFEVSYNIIIFCSSKSLAKRGCKTLFREYLYRRSIHLQEE